jgi:hypothetical protein
MLTLVALNRCAGQPFFPTFHLIQLILQSRMQKATTVVTMELAARDLMSLAYPGATGSGYNTARCVT